MGGSLIYEELEEMFKIYPFFKCIKNFVETGTYKGDTSIMASAHFDKVFTMEIMETLYSESKERAKKEGIQNISFYLGDSLNSLTEIMPNIKDGAVFFIDAHQSGPDTGNNQKQRVPLYEELDIILSYELGPCVFIFDDVRFWKDQGEQVWDWEHISTDLVLKRFQDKKEIIDSYVKNDRFFVLAN